MKFPMRWVPRRWQRWYLDRFQPGLPVPVGLWTVDELERWLDEHREPDR